MGRKLEDRIEEIEKCEADWERTAQAAEASRESREQTAQAAEALEAHRTPESRRPEASGEGKRGKGKMEKKRRLTGSMGAKVTAFFALAIFSFLGLVSILACLYMGMEGYYISTKNDVLTKELHGMMRAAAYEAKDWLEFGDTGAAAEICQGTNLDLELYFYDGAQNRRVIWSTWDGYDTKITENVYCAFDGRVDGIAIGGHALKPGEYWIRAYVDPAFPEADEFQSLAAMVTWGYEYRYLLIGLAVGCVFICAVCFVFLLCAAGHRNGMEGIVPGVLTGFYLDVLTAMFGGALLFLGAAALRLVQEVYYYGMAAVGVAAVGAVMTVLTTFYLMDLALRWKRGKWWRHSLIFVVLRMLWRGGRFICRGIAALQRQIPSVLTTAILFWGISIFELAPLFFARAGVGILLLGLEKLVLFFVVMYVAVTCKKLLTASRALAEGQENYRVDTSKMFGDFKEHGEHLNSLGQGISRAVAERMKSEHLKTELITNVSHDIKTPLTSIINYADLICEEMGNETEGKRQGPKASLMQASGEQAGSGGEAQDQEASSKEDRIREYAEVLLRQSRRLKKLLEDLVEASKATTGNLEVDLKPCEVGVLLSQAAGEYQQRMEEKELELIARQPEYPVTILADGRHLWRVFDNLLNNICKYAQERSRVYLSVEENEDHVLIIFRNMSKYPLDISGEELEERFVRGDRSRHMDGNGLGLSIAKSLVQLQDGKMEIVIDGDLFKVILRFGVRTSM